MAENTGPIPFPAGGPNIPIIGQPYHLKAVIPTVLATCGCESKEPLLLIGLGARVTCRGCGRPFVLESFAGDRASDNVNATLGVGVLKGGG